MLTSEVKLGNIFLKLIAFSMTVLPKQVKEKKTYVQKVTTQLSNSAVSFEGFPMEGPQIVCQKKGTICVTSGAPKVL